MPMPQGGLPVPQQPVQMMTAPSGLEQMKQMLQIQQQQYAQQQASTDRIHALQGRRDDLINQQIEGMNVGYDAAYPEPKPNLLSSFAAGVRGAGAFPGTKPALGTFLGAMTGLDYQNKDMENRSRARALAQAKLAENEGVLRTKGLDSDIKSEVEILKANKLASSFARGAAGSMDHSTLTGSQKSAIYQMNYKKAVESGVEDPEVWAMEKTMRDIQALDSGQTGIAPTEQPTLKSAAELAGSKTDATKASELHFANVDKNYKAPAASADKILADLDSIEKLGPITGTGAEAWRWIGNAAASLGVDNALTRNAGSLTEASKIIARSVNDRVRQEVGVQTASDVQRFQDEVQKITEPKAVFDFTIRYAREIAKLAQDKATFADYWNSNMLTGKDQQGNPISGGTKFTNTGMDSVWKAAMAENGPIMEMVGGKPMFKSEWVERFIAKYGKGTTDPEELSQLSNDAVRQWVKFSKENKNRGR